MRRHPATSVIVLGALALAGCTPFRHKSHLDYRTVKTDPNHDLEHAKAENQRAIRLLEKEKPERAEAALQQALIADVNYGPAHNNLGKLYFSQGKFYLAAWEFEYAIRLMPQRPECQNNLGLVYESVGKLDEAIDSYAAAHEMDPKNPEFMGNLARAKFRRGNRDPQIAGLMNDLQFYDCREDWVSWAGEQLALGRVAPKVAPASVGLPPDKAHAPNDTPAEPIDFPPPDPAGPQFRATQELPPPVEKRLPEVMPAPEH